jgi:hypothetical protein
LVAKGEMWTTNLDDVNVGLINSHEHMRNMLWIRKIKSYGLEREKHEKL